MKNNNPRPSGPQPATKIIAGIAAIALVVLFIVFWPRGNRSADIAQIEEVPMEYPEVGILETDKVAEPYEEGSPYEEESLPEEYPITEIMIVEEPSTSTSPAQQLQNELTEVLGPRISEPVAEEAPTPEMEEEPLNVAMVEEPPVFPGGQAAMYQWLSEHVTFPAEAANDGVSGRVVVQFMVDKDGSIQNVRLVRSRHPALDREAVRVVRSMPAWTPGRNNGRPVRVIYTLPITFRAQG